MKESYKYIILITLLFLVFAIIDVSLSGIFKTYLTIIFTSFCITKVENYKIIIPFVVLSGIINDTLFSGYIGPFTVIFLLTLALYKFIKSYFPINRFTSFLLTSSLIVLALSLRLKFYGILKFELSTLIFSIILYPLMNAVFKKGGEITAKYE